MRKIYPSDWENLFQFEIIFNELWWLILVLIIIAKYGHTYIMIFLWTYIRIMNMVKGSSWGGNHLISSLYLRLWNHTCEQLIWRWDVPICNIIIRSFNFLPNYLARKTCISKNMDMVGLLLRCYEVQMPFSTAHILLQIKLLGNEIWLLI